MLFKALVFRVAQDATLLHRLRRKRRMCFCFRKNVFMLEVMLNSRDFFKLQPS